MDELLKYAHIFNVKARGHQEKTEILRTVAELYGRQGIKEMALLIDKSGKELETYGNLREYFDDKNRRRRQRKKPIRRTERDYIPYWLPKELMRWQK